MDDKNQKQNDEKPLQRFDSASLMKAALIMFVGGVVGTVLLADAAPENQKTVVVGIAMSAFIGGGIKLLQMLQTHGTDRKVDRDLETTKSVASALNGGFDDRVKGIVRGVLEAELPAALAKALQAHSDKPDKPPR